MAGRGDAQARADRIEVFREELAQLEQELGGVLDDAQRARIAATREVRKTRTTKCGSEAALAYLGGLSRATPRIGVSLIDKIRFRQTDRFRFIGKP